MERSELVRAIEDAMSRRIRLPHQVASIGMDLFLLQQVDAEQGAFERLREQYGSLVEGSGFTDITTRQMTYATRLADSNGPLMYEEMHKLFGLCDEVHALQTLGFEADATSSAQFEVAVRERLKLQSREARLVAEDRAAAWTADLWWYSEALGGKS